MTSDQAKKQHKDDKSEQTQANGQTLSNPLSLKSTTRLIHRTLENANGQPLKTEPVQVDGHPLTYFGKPVSITTEDNKKIRRMKREFNEKAAAGLLPASENNNVLEWGEPNGLRTLFNEVAHNDKVNYLHLKEISVGNAVDAKTAPTKRAFVTGSCLFGKSGVSGITNKGHILNLCDPYQMRDATPEQYGKIQKLDCMENFHGYEIQSALSRQGIFEMTSADKIYFNAPYMPYLLYAREAMRRGLMDKDVFDDWTQKLSDRVADIIEYERDVSSAEINAVDPLYKYIELVTDTSLSMENIANKISEDDPWWAAYFANSPPETFADLGYGSYSKVYYDLLNTPEDIEVVAIEDQVETRILYELASLLKNDVLPQPPGNNRMVGIYPFIQFLGIDADGTATAAFLSEHYGRKDLSSEIFTLAASSVPETIIKRAEASYKKICDKQATRATGGGTHEALALSLHCKIP